jgi:hypothetical protein
LFLASAGSANAESPEAGQAPAAGTPSATGQPGTGAGAPAGEPLAPGGMQNRGPGAVEGTVTAPGQMPGGMENHVKEAMKHVKVSATAGTKGNTSEIAKHAELGRVHVDAALKERPNDPHLTAALKSLDQAIMKSRRGDGEEARKAAKEAQDHLKMAGEGKPQP